MKEADLKGYIPYDSSSVVWNRQKAVETVKRPEVARHSEGERDEKKEWRVSSR